MVYLPMIHGSFPCKIPMATLGPPQPQPAKPTAPRPAEARLLRVDR